MKFSIDQLLRGSFVPRTARYLEYLQLAPNMLGKLGGKNAATARMCVRARRTKRAIFGVEDESLKKFSDEKNPLKTGLSAV